MLTSLAVSLALTLILEGLLALLWGVKDRWDWLLLLLVNVVTNPICTTCWEAGSPSLSGWSSLRWYLSGWPTGSGGGTPARPSYSPCAPTASPIAAGCCSTP